MRFLDAASDFHPFECDGPGKCAHCGRSGSERHDPSTCALCDPEYDMQPNPFWDQRVENERRVEVRGVE